MFKRSYIETGIHWTVHFARPFKYIHSISPPNITTKSNSAIKVGSEVKKRVLTDELTEVCESYDEHESLNVNTEKRIDCPDTKHPIPSS